jgi:acyl-CoA reductase-like NAD-dependent aldehyde dehydrogenase
MKVTSDEEALRLMNASELSVSAAIFSASLPRAEALGDVLDTDTVFLNRCGHGPVPSSTGDEAWEAGCRSSIGFEQLTRPKPYLFTAATGGR